MIKIKLTTKFPQFPIIRQTPSALGRWGDCVFFIDNDKIDCDYWVVYDGLSKPACASCSKDRIILITGEPPTIHNYDKNFINQFSTVITCHRGIKGKNVIYSQQALPWRLGWDVKQFKSTRDYDFFKNYKYPKTRRKLLSLITSNKKSTRGHRERLEFALKIKNYFKNDVDLYGDNINHTADKWEAINNYRYNIAIENTSIDDYWTEKLSDAFLGGAYPLYFGCSNIYDYFPQNSLRTINIHNLNESISTIKNAIRDDLYEKYFADLTLARNLVLDEYNLFALLTNLCTNKASRKDKSLISIFPERNESVFKKIKKALIHD